MTTFYHLLHGSFTLKVRRPKISHVVVHNSFKPDECFTFCTCEHISGESHGLLPEAFGKGGLGSRAPSRGGLLDDEFSRELESARVEITSLRAESDAKDARIAELEEYIAEGEAIVEPPQGKSAGDDVGAVRIPTAAAASEEMDEHAAATRIQAMHRGRVAREEVQVKKLVSGALDSVTQGDGS